MHHPLRSAVAAVTALTLVACSSGDDSSGDTIAAPSSASSTTAVTDPPRSDPAETSAVSATDPPATDPSPTDPPATDPPATDPPATDPPPSEVATTTSPPTTTAVPATSTTEPLALQELLLRGDGLGSAVFGAAPDGVVDYVRSILGGNTGDTGWVDPFTFAACTGTVARRVDWGVLSLLFSDESEFGSGRRHFIGWEYGRVGQIGDEPVGLRTPGGVTLGSRVVDLLAEFPEASINEGEEDINFPPNFYVSDVFYGLLTGTSDDDVVTVMFGGYGCGE